MLPCRLLAAVEDGVKLFAYNARRFSFSAKRPRNPDRLLIANQMTIAA
jgi:hypothetical protein